MNLNITNLTEQQIKAVQYTQGPCVIAAGPGSGKTTVMAIKEAQLLNLGYSPERIVSITFTNKASAEMKKRINAITGIPIENFPWIRTIHSFCLHLLKAECTRLGFKAPVSIYGASSQKAIMRIVMSQIGLNKKFLKNTLSMISRAKNSIDPIAYIRNGHYAIQNERTYNLYEEMLIRNNAVDLDGIIFWALKLLRDHEDLRTDIQEYFQYILVDEFQDCNDVQNEIISMIVNNGNFTVVGDDYQSIYSFRGANPGHFINFANNYENAGSIFLEENHRCTNVISAASNTLINNNTIQRFKNCFSKKPGGPIECKKFQNQKQEAFWVANQCLTLYHQQGIPLEKMGVLYRTREPLPDFEEAMTKMRVPYTVVGSIGLFGRREIRVIECYLMSAINPQDDTSFEYILNIPARGIGKKALARINSIRTEEMCLFEACARAVNKKILTTKVHENLRDLLVGLRKLKDMRPDKAIEAIMNRFGYANYLTSNQMAQKKYQPMLDRIKLLRDLAATRTKISAFLEDIALFNEDREEMDREGVRISTIHAVKGLGYQAVFMVALEENILPHSAPIRARGAEGLLQMEEERRVMFVGMTRAKTQLYLSYSTCRNGKTTNPSRFLQELPTEYLRIENVKPFNLAMQ
jgi:DNA helicase II / ATP-dependent DNA helicase PcrA